MNKDELKGKAENLKGRVKQAVGALTGDKSTEGGGLFDRVRGAVREKLGKAQALRSPATSPHVDDETTQIAQLSRYLRTQTPSGPQRPDGAHAASPVQRFGAHTVTVGRCAHRPRGAQASSGSRSQSTPTVHAARQSWRPSASRVHVASSGQGWLSSQLALQTPSAPTSAHRPVAQASSASTSLASRQGPPRSRTAPSGRQPRVQGVAAVVEPAGRV